MTTAILLSGQLRTWRLCGILLRKFILAHHECDLFMCVDRDNSSQSVYRNAREPTGSHELNDAIRFYAPTRVTSDVPYDFAPIRRRLEAGHPGPFTAYQRGRIHVTRAGDRFTYDRLHDKTTPRFQCRVDTRPIYEPVFRQYFYLSQCHELMEAYARETTVTYDRVLRVRFDQLFYTPRLLRAVYSRFERDAQGKVAYSATNIARAGELPADDLALDLDVVTSDGDIYVFGAGDNHGYFYVNDQFWTTSFTTSGRVMKRFHEELFGIVGASQDDGWPVYEAWTEHWFATFLARHRLTIKKSRIADGDFVRMT